MDTIWHWLYRDLQSRATSAVAVPLRVDEDWVLDDGTVDHLSTYEFTFLELHDSIVRADGGVGDDAVIRATIACDSVLQLSAWWLYLLRRRDPPPRPWAVVARASEPRCACVRSVCGCVPPEREHVRHPAPVPQPGKLHKGRERLSVHSPVPLLSPRVVCPVVDKMYSRVTKSDQSGPGHDGDSRRRLAFSGEYTEPERFVAPPLPRSTRTAARLQRRGRERGAGCGWWSCRCGVAPSWHGWRRRRRLGQ